MDDPEGPRGPDLVVVLAEPKTPGNVGAVARAMANFGISQLRIVEGVPLDEDAYKRALHAAPILEEARHFDDFASALEGLDFTAGTSGIVNTNDKRHVRNPLTPVQLAERVAPMDGTVGLVFGREDYGLFLAELARCDVVVTVSTSPKYPVMNLSHAVAVLLYELHREIPLPHETIKASGTERDLLLATFDDMLSATDYPPHKVENTRVMLRRIIGRSTLSEWEYHTLMGIIQRANKRIKRLEEKAGPPWDED
ncbi:MAG: RNA methyltransferase [Candidatus Thermoplasmatota archaeon]|nr:RNA methyltransferase [Candidatus Thermoplasmatota archaeon]